MKDSRRSTRTPAASRKGKAKRRSASQQTASKQDKKGNGHEQKGNGVSTNGKAPPKAEPIQVPQTPENKSRRSPSSRSKQPASAALRPEHERHVKPTYLLTFLGIHYDRSTQKPRGQQFQVRTTAENRSVAAFYGMGAAEKVSRFFEKKIEVAILISSQCIGPVLLAEETLPVPECWIEAFELAPVSRHLFNEKGEEIHG